MENNDKFILGLVSGICLTIAAVLLMTQGIVDVNVKTKKGKGSKTNKTPGKKQPGPPHGQI
jgi:hypothetical protein